MMETVVLATLIASWLALFAAATVAPFLQAAGVDRDAAPLSMPSRHRNAADGTQAA